MRVAPEWAAAPLQGVKFDRNESELPRYASIEQRFRGQVQTLASQFEAGALTKDQAMRIMRERLQVAETESFAAGRRARGIASLEITDGEAAMLQGRHSRNMRYFSGFLDDIEGGKYANGRNGLMTIPKRASMYAESLWSIYNRSDAIDWNDPEAANARYYWVLDPDAEHCKDCIERARNSRDKDGFTFEELVAIGFPGENTICLTRCRCHIRTVHKKVLLPEKFEDIEPAPTPTAGVEKLIEMIGGPESPLRIPAAGIPSAGINLDVIETSLREAGSHNQMSELGRQLPLLPLVLTKPDVAWEPYDGARSYWRRGMLVNLNRDDSGRWRIVFIGFGMPPVVPHGQRLELCA